ncbi:MULTISPECIES: DUF1414 domain-containing protein [Idiomarina]|uniref:DUF1414 domain-containing protein n=1 Tax=Idiomarina TaxID=135575 RepID=UPI00129BDE28|nr:MULTISPECIES: DUF1414 domain-containing protein [Idiomarina]MRJ40759.1 DUF1414 domain-containing protein [Idiomarina sp. FeN1]NCU56563.1 DUF1414 domain-containing protein [Idiomarina sp. FenA--70]NCU58943.1 DUF1414 domain-containing protein [Idiomarina sp. FenBw--71]UUN14558.1 DUF1414 domain-containing protein [Idiomarina loihiensis]
MPIVSKYNANQQQQLLDDVLAVFSQHQAPTDLILMTLGNAVSNTIQARYHPDDTHKIAEQFGKVLLQSLASNKQ